MATFAVNPSELMLPLIRGVDIQEYPDSRLFMSSRCKHLISALFLNHVEKYFSAGCSIKTSHFSKLISADPQLSSKWKVLIKLIVQLGAEYASSYFYFTPFWIERSITNNDAQQTVIAFIASEDKTWRQKELLKMFPPPLEEENFVTKLSSRQEEVIGLLYLRSKFCVRFGNERKKKRCENKENNSRCFCLFKTRNFPHLILP